MYELPKTPPELRTTFEHLCRSFPPDCIPELRMGVHAALERLSHLKDSYLGPNLELAQDIARRVYYLIENYQSFPPEKHHLIVGAIRYFMIEKDIVPDSRPITGLDDDARVVNYVLEQLGIPDMFIDMP